MKIESKSNFAPCPPYRGKAVCVDVTPLKLVQTDFGTKEKFKFVFELDMPREDGSRWCVWSRGFTPSNHEKAALVPFLKDWMGKAMSAADWKNFDTENLLGVSAEIIIINESRDGETYAQIKFIAPDTSGAPLQPSGKYVRVVDRPAQDGGRPHTPRTATQSAHEAPVTPVPKAAPAYAINGTNFGDVKLHVGKCKGQALRDLTPEQLAGLLTHWLPAAQANSKPTADDQRLMKALAIATDKSSDDVPY